MTINEFIPLSYDDESGNIGDIKDKEGKQKCFKTRKACETYCEKNKCLYVERKSIFYK